MKPIGASLSRRLAAGFVAALLAASEGQATEGGSVAGPLGGADLRAALAPPPGNYLLLLPLGGRVVDFRDNDGKRVPLRYSGGSMGMGLGLYRVFEGTVLGGRIGAGVVAVAGEACLRVEELQRSQCRSGFGDTYLETFWSRPIGELGLAGPPADDPRRQYIPYGLTVGLALGAVLPTGAYRSTDLVPIGLNTPVLAPSVSATWTSPPLLADGTEVSARLFYNIHGRNRATDYRAGELLVLDWAVTERMGAFQFGPTGSYARQMRPDRAAGTNGPSTEVLSLGAVAALDLPQLGMFVSAKALRDVEAAYRLRVDRAILRIGIGF